MIRSKAYVSTEEMGDQYCLIGPYKETSARTEVEEGNFLPHNPLNQTVQKMRDQGYKVSPARVSSRIFAFDPFTLAVSHSRGCEC